MKSTLQIIRHRVNTLADLRTLAPEWGAEIDLRSDVGSPGRIHLSHDPWVRGLDFEQWIEGAVQKKLRGPIILNTKEDGLEDRAASLMKEAGLDNYFFLDTALPTLVKKTRSPSRAPFAVRLSRYEPAELAMHFETQVEWLWADCFDGEPVAPAVLDGLDPGVRVCLVSPELQGRTLEAIAAFKPLLSRADAVCTKDPSAWLSLVCA